MCVVLFRTLERDLSSQEHELTTGDNIENHKCWEVSFSLLIYLNH